MIWKRQEYIAHCQYEFTGREMFCQLFGPLAPLVNEWKKQGATPAEIGLTAFDWDYVLKTWLSGGCGPITGLKPVVLEDTPEYTITRDGLGRTMKLIKSSATIPLPLDHPVKTMDDWLKIKHWYTFREDRVNKEQLLQEKKLYDLGYLTLFGVPGGFDEPRQLLGEEGLCMAFFDEPEMIEDMLSTFTDTALKVMERVGQIVPIDVLCIHEDMAGKSGPLIGPNQIDRFLAPYYSQVWECAKSFGATQFSQDSDGNMNSVIDSFMACGVNCFYPCEPAAGMDMVALKKKYGKKIFFKGGIDKFTLRKNPAAIRKELEYKMSEPMLGGGTVFAIDHLIPNGVSLENYWYYVNTGRELLGLPPVSGEGWERMAF